MYIQALGARPRSGLAPPGRRRAAPGRLPTSGRPTRTSTATAAGRVELLVDRPRAGRRRPAVAHGAEHRGARGVRRAGCSGPASVVAGRHALAASAGSGRRSTSASRRSRSSRCSPASARRYLIVYPFTKSTDWYLLAQGGAPGRDERAHARRPRLPDRPPGCWPTRSGSTRRTSSSPTRPTTWSRSATSSAPCGRTESRRSTVNDTPILLGHPSADRRDPRPAGGRLMAELVTGSRTAGARRARRGASSRAASTALCAPSAPSAGRRSSSSAARGACVWDADGRRYIDYIGAWGPAILGHAAPGGRRRDRDAAGERAGARRDQPRARSSWARRSAPRCRRWSACASPRRAPRRS